MGTGGDPRGWAGRTRRWWEGPSPCVEQTRQARQRGGRAMTMPGVSRCSGQLVVDVVIAVVPDDAGISGEVRRSE